MVTLDSLLQDVRHACRLLATRPGWTVAAIVCLTIATGANTAAFTLVNGLLLRPLPFDEPDRLVMVGLQEPSQPTTRPFALREYRDVAAAAGGAARLLARTFFPLSLSSDDGAAMAQAELVSGNYFDVLGVTPLAGRFFDDTADRPHDEPVAVLNHALWVRRFAGDPAAVGRVVRVNGRPATIVGVAPAGFVGATQLVAADLWLPAALYPELAGSTNADQVPMFGVMGRLAPTVTLEDARARIAAIVATQARARGVSSPLTAVVTPASGFGVPPAARGAVRGVSALIFGLMTLLIVVASANVAGLVLARGTSRSVEIGVRLALGAGRMRIARQLLVESVVLAVVGCAAGAVVAIWLTNVLVARLSTGFSYVNYAIDVRPDARVFLYSSLMSVAAALLCGLAPVRHAMRLDVVEVLGRSGTKGSTRTPKRTLHAMVVTQFAVSTALLVGAGLLVRAYLDAEAIEPGFSTANLMAISLDVDQARLDPPAGRRFYQTLSERLSALPGVEHVGLTRAAPLGSSGPGVAIVAVGAVGVHVPDEPFTADTQVVTPGYFRALGVPILQGRHFRDLEPVPSRVAIVNQAMAARLSPGGSPLGLTFALNQAAGDRIEVVGVVADLTQRLMDDRPRPAFYLPFSQQYSARMTVLMRTRGDPRPMFDEVRRRIREADPNLAILELRTVDDQREVALARRRAPATLLTLVCALGLLLSAVGLYGVTTYGVRERAREFGIRLALGARPADVRRLVLRQGFGVIGLGLVAGGVASIGVTAVVRRAFVGVGSGDPLTMSAVGGMLLLTALAALYLPARWASRLEPARTLGCE